MLMLTWNLFHGRSVPGAGHDLRVEFEAALAGWDWDVALLQEVPPWWPEQLARACDATQSTALTSRNFALPARRASAQRRPDLIKSNGGGANAILVRGPVAAQRRELLRRWPERRVCHAVLLADGTWCANLHAEAHGAGRAQADIARAATATRAWAQGAPAILGGDFNVRAPQVLGFEALAAHHVDHILGAGLQAAGPPQLPEHGPLSDHAPVIVDVVRREVSPAG